MQPFHNDTVRATALALVLLLAGAGGAAAQQYSNGSIVGNGFQPPVKGGGVVPQRKQLPPPPALPGAANAAPAAPPTRSPTDMAPTDALFDAIDRGDMAAARDALSRGADLYARNVLGMTPLDLSVDLSRNDITFLLLSLRRASPEIGPPPGAAAEAAAALPPGRAGKPARSPAAGLHLAATVRAVRRPIPEAAPGVVHYAASDPGTPVPQAGFLGFGGAALR